MAKRSSTSKRSRPELGPNCRILLLKGKDAFLRSQYTKELGKAVAEAGLPVDVLRFDGESAEPAEILDECRGMGLMGQYKLVIVDNADQFLLAEGRRSLIERYAASPAQGATLVLRAHTWRKGKLDPLIEKVGTIISCDELTPDRARASVNKRAGETYGVQIEREAVDLLVDRVGVELGRLDAELAKLGPAAGESGTITVDLVRRMVALTREQKAWIIQDLLLDPNPEPALQKLHELVDDARVNPVPIRWACIDLAQKLNTVVCELKQGVSPRNAGQSLRLWGPSAQAIRRLAPRISPRATASLLGQAVETDLRGKTSQGDPVRALELLILRFASIAGRRVDNSGAGA